MQIGAELFAHALERLLAGAAGYDDVDAQFAGVDHLDVNAGLGQNFEHPDGYAGVAPKSDTADRQFGDLFAAVHAAKSELAAKLLHNLETLVKLRARNRKTNTGFTLVAVAALNDHVDEYACGGDCVKDIGRQAGLIGHADNGHASLIVD